MNFNSMQAFSLYTFMYKCMRLVLQVRQYSELWNLSKQKAQDLLRGLYEAYVECGQRLVICRAIHFSNIAQLIVTDPSPSPLVY